MNLGEPPYIDDERTLNGNVSCEDLEKMSAKNVRDLKRARLFALPSISKQYSPRNAQNVNESYDFVMKVGGRQNKYQTIVEESSTDHVNFEP